MDRSRLGTWGETSVCWIVYSSPHVKYLPSCCFGTWRTRLWRLPNVLFSLQVNPRWCFVNLFPLSRTVPRANAYCRLLVKNSRATVEKSRCAPVVFIQQRSLAATNEARSWMLCPWYNAKSIQRLHFPGLPTLSKSQSMHKPMVKIRTVYLAVIVLKPRQNKESKHFVAKAPTRYR